MVSTSQTPASRLCSQETEERRKTHYCIPWNCFMTPGLWASHSRFLLPFSFVPDTAAAEEASGSSSWQPWDGDYTSCWCRSSREASQPALKRTWQKYMMGKNVIEIDDFSRCYCWSYSAISDITPTPLRFSMLSFLKAYWRKTSSGFPSQLLIVFNYWIVLSTLSLTSFPN